MLDNDEDLQTLFDLVDANDIKQVDMIVVPQSIVSSEVNDLIPDESQIEWLMEYEKCNNIIIVCFTSKKCVIIITLIQWYNVLTLGYSFILFINVIKYIFCS
ncbi:hypothetical protein U1Q18_052650 [Sarracenia purpurea var. burkii]